jgi:hypothetical protein
VEDVDQFFKGLLSWTIHSRGNGRSQGAAMGCSDVPFDPEASDAWMDMHGAATTNK